MCRVYLEAQFVGVVHDAFDVLEDLTGARRWLSDSPSTHSLFSFVYHSEQHRMSPNTESKFLSSNLHCGSYKYVQLMYCKRARQMRGKA